MIFVRHEGHLRCCILRNNNDPVVCCLLSLLISACILSLYSQSQMSADEIKAVISCGTTKGPIVMEMVREWSPHGYDRAVELFESGFYDESHFFRVVPHFLVQFGISYSQDATLKQLGRSTIPDDPQLDPPIKFEPGIISYAGEYYR
jgi:Cyclophilin type peptidyl-prolyl cis-trans isomerase/CLD